MCYSYPLPQVSTRQVEEVLVANTIPLHTHIYIYIERAREKERERRESRKVI